MRLRRLSVTLFIAGALVAGGAGAACSDPEYDTQTVTEDCDLEDQSAREDDCGYWMNGTEYRVGAQPSPMWVWVWWAWVTPGVLSTPPANWKPPHNLKAPTKIVKVPRKSKNCALGQMLTIPGYAPRPPAPPRPANPPANRPANRPAGGQVKC
jgi:hypothetical protein